MNYFEFKSEFNCKDLIKDLQSLSVRVHREISYADGTNPLGRAAVTIEALMTALETASVMGWVKATPETMPPDMELVMVTVFHEGIVEEDTFSAVFNGDSFDLRLEKERQVVPGMRWNKRLQAWEITAWDGCKFEWTTYHDLVVTHWMPYPKPAED